MTRTRLVGLRKPHLMRHPVNVWLCYTNRYYDEGAHMGFGSTMEDAFTSWFFGEYDDEME